MKLIVNNNEIPIISLSINQNINLYYSYVQINTLVPLRTKFILEESIKETYYPLKTTYLKDRFLTVAVSEKTFKLLNTITNSYAGNATIKNVLNSLGIPFRSNYDSLASDWVIPKMNIMNLIKLLNTYTNIGNGGGVRFYIDINGELSMLDLHKEFNTSSVAEYDFEPSFDEVDTSWIIKSPGIVNMINSSIDGINKERIVFMEGYGEGTIYINNTTGQGLDLKRQAYRNQFFYNYYNSRKITTDCEVPPAIGQVIKLIGLDEKFITIGVETIVTTNDESLNKLTLITHP